MTAVVGAQFIGEDAIDHTAENEVLKLSPGNAFDITAEREQRVFASKRLKTPNQILTDTGIRITVSNAKEAAVTVRVEEPIPGEWMVVKSSLLHKRMGNTAVWLLEVPAKGKATLDFRVEAKL